MLRLKAINGFFMLMISCALLPRAKAANFSQAPSIFDVRINLPLEPDEATYHDFYINAGSEAGFKKGMFLTVVRPVPVHDPVQNKQQGMLNIGVARLQVIHVERQITVARLFAEFTDEDRPTLEFEAVMIGDRIDPQSMTMEAPNSRKNQPKSEKKGSKRAEANPEPAVEPKAERKLEPAPVPAPAPETKPEPKAEAKSEPAPKSASPESPGPGIVRVPVPPEKTREM